MLNGDLRPDEVTWGSSKDVWWHCPHGHQWQASPKDRNRGYGCSVCAGKVVVAGVNDLASLAPELAAEWHPSLNGDLGPENVTRHSGKKVWWLGMCGHPYPAIIKMRSVGTGCPVCAGKRVVADENSLAARFPEVAAEWHPTMNEDLLPDAVAWSSGKSAWWFGKCGHEWPQRVNARTSSGVGCPYCSGNSVLVGFNDLATTHPEAAAQWHPTLNGETTPRDVSFGSNKDIWWQCEFGHDWRRSPAAFIAHAAGCPRCALSSESKIERAIRECLVSAGSRCEYPCDAIRDGKGRAMKPDIVLREIGVIVEYDGSYWHGLDGVLERDKRKTRRLQALGWKVLRVRCGDLPRVQQSDVFVGDHDPAEHVAGRIIEWLKRNGLADVDGQNVRASDALFLSGS